MDGYYSHERKELIDLLEHTPARVLEIGCSSGRTLQSVKERGAEELFGVERDSAAARKAREVADHVWEEDVTAFEVPLEHESIDLLVLADVLEHLSDPWGLLRRWLVYVKSGGTVLVSLPNVRHFSVVLPLLFKGNWPYADRGILDRTHLRFFTRRTAGELLRSADLRIERVVASMGPRRGVLDRLTLGAFRELLATQYLFRARK